MKKITLYYILCFFTLITAASAENPVIEKAKIEAKILNNKAIYLLTIDKSQEMGSYNGPITYFLEFQNGSGQFVIEKKGLMKSLKSDWKIVNVENKDEILEIYCAPDGKGNFSTTYNRYISNGKDWIKKSTSVKGEFWENEDESSFPEESSFPK